MSGAATCDTHAWASLGVVSDEGTVFRIWECENCQVWTMEPFDTDYRLPWDDTWLADR